MKYLKKRINILAIIVLVLVNKFAFAGALNVAFVDSITQVATGWVSPLMKVGVYIGVSFWFIETLLSMKFKQSYESPQGLLIFALKRSIIFGVLNTIFLNFDLYQGITQLFTNQVATLTNIQVSPGGIGLNPGDVWQQYSIWWTKDFGPTISGLKISQAGAQIALVIFAAFFFAMTLIICFDMVILMVKFKIILYAGIMFAGCWGSDWVKSYWHKYVGALVGISFQVLIFCLIYSAYKTTLSYGGLKNMVAGGLISTNFLLQLISIAIAAATLHTVPGWMSGIFSGVGSDGSSVAGIIGSVFNMGANAKSLYNNTGGVMSGVKNMAGKIGSLMSGKSGSGSNSPGGNSSGSKQPPINKSDKSSFMNKK